MSNYDFDGNHKDEATTEGEKNGRLAGAGAGVITGARLGTLLIPVPVVGTFTGAFVGGIIGSKFGKKIGANLSERFGSPSKPSVSQELERLSNLKEQGILSEEEFKAAKAKLLNL
jgi:phage tail tape-measure protein